MNDIDTSEYYVVRRGEYDDMKAEIERLRAENERLSESLGNAMRLLAVRNEARRG